MPITTTFASLSTKAFYENKKTLNAIRPYIAVLNKTVTTATIWVGTDVTNFQDGIYIDWGDGQIQQVQALKGPVRYQHTYATTGKKTVRIICTSGKISIQNDTETVDVLQWGNQKFVSTYNMFEQCRQLYTFTTPEKPDLSICYDTSYMFSLASNFNSPSVSTWDVSNVTNMSGMFRSALLFNQPLNSWNVSNVTNMSDMFAGAVNFNQPLNLWNVGKVTDMSGIFSGAVYFNQPLNSWNVSNVTNMNGMFAAISSTIFPYATYFDQPLNSWNVGKVTDMGSMFAGAVNFNQPLSTWNVSNVTNMNSMFTRTNKFNQPLNSWNVSNVTNMNSMFNRCLVFNQDINLWNVGKVTDMSNMFYYSFAFNKPLNSWNVSNVINMDYMFSYSQVFNQNLSNWVTGLTFQPSYFSTNANATWVASKATTYPFLNDGVTRILT